MHVAFSSRGGQFVLMSSLNTDTLTSSQKVVLLNFVHEVNKVRIRYHPLYLLLHPVIFGLVGGLFALTFLLDVKLLLIPAILVAMLAFLFVLRYFYIVRSVSVKWAGLVAQVSEKLPTFNLVRGRYRFLFARMYFFNCRGLQFRMTLPPTDTVQLLKPEQAPCLTKKDSHCKFNGDSLATSHQRLTVVATSETLAISPSGALLVRRGLNGIGSWKDDPVDSPQPLDTSILEQDFESSDAAPEAPAQSSNSLDPTRGLTSTDLVLDRPRLG